MMDTIWEELKDIAVMEQAPQMDRRTMGHDVGSGKRKKLIICKQRSVSVCVIRSARCARIGRKVSGKQLMMTLTSERNKV